MNFVTIKVQPILRRNEHLEVHALPCRLRVLGSDYHPSASKTVSQGLEAVAHRKFTHFPRAKKETPRPVSRSGRFGIALDDDLLSHGETPHYHRRCIVSLLSSEWDQVVPMLYCRQAIRCYAAVCPHGVKGGKSDSVQTRGNCNLMQFQTVVQCVKP